MAEPWVLPVITILGSVGSAWAGVRIGLARGEEKLAALVGRMEKVEREIGTHETGLRGHAHRIGADIPKLYGRVEALEERLEALENRMEVAESRLNRRTR